MSMSLATVLLAAVLIGLCLVLAKKSGGGCCGGKKTDSPDKKDSDKQGCCDGH